MVEAKQLVGGCNRERGIEMAVLTSAVKGSNLISGKAAFSLGVSSKTTSVLGVAIQILFLAASAASIPANKTSVFPAPHTAQIKCSWIVEWLQLHGQMLPAALPKASPAIV